MGHAGPRIGHQRRRIGAAAAGRAGACWAASASGGTGGGLASRFGLDEIGFKGPGSGGDVRESAVTVGKRISKDFYVTYERSLAGTLGTLFIFYDLTTPPHPARPGGPAERDRPDLHLQVRLNW